MTDKEIDALVKQIVSKPFLEGEMRGDVEFTIKELIKMDIIK